MNLSYIISSAITGTFSICLGIFIYFKKRESTVNKTFMLMSLSISVWAWSLFGRDMTDEKTTALFFVRLCYVGAIFVPALFFHFINYDLIPFSSSNKEGINLSFELRDI